MRMRLALLGCLCVIACEQSVHLKTTRPVSKIIIDGEDIGASDTLGREVLLPVRFGPAHYQLFDERGLIAKDVVERSHLDPWVFGASVGSAMFLAPALSFLGVLLVNPAWVFSTTVFLNGGGAGSFLAFLSQTASFWTFPAATLGFCIGLLPLLGLLRAERLPDVILLSAPEEERWR